MKVLVLMSTYNGEKYLNTQIDSIINQKGDFEVFLHVRDDGSSDQTVRILESYALSNSNITFDKGENIGYAASFVRLLNEVDGYDYYAFSDQDDTWLPEKLDVAIAAIRNMNGPAMYASCSYLTDDTNNILGTTQMQVKPITPYNAFIECFMPGHTQVINHALLKKLQGDYDISKIYAHDFWFTTYAINFAKVAFDNEAHTYYRQHSANVTGYANGKGAWVKQRLRRVLKKEANRRAAQIYYFYQYYYDQLDPDVQMEMSKFFSSKNFFSRISYIMRTKLYYQSKSKTLLYKLLYVYGGYKPL